MIITEKIADKYKIVKENKQISISRNDKIIISNIKECILGTADMKAQRCIKSLIKNEKKDSILVDKIANALVEHYERDNNPKRILHFFKKVVEDI